LAITDLYETQGQPENMSRLLGEIKQDLRDSDLL